MSLNYSQEVADDLEKLLETDEDCNVIIYAGENENTKEFHAHSNILRIRSQYFRTAFSSEWANKKDGKFILNKPNISPQLFKIILRFIYCGKIDLTALQGPEILKLLIAADELSIQLLVSCVQEYSIKHQDKFLQQNPIELLETVYQHESFTDLWNYCLEKICKGPGVLFNSDKFINLKAPLLELLLKRDDLKLDEIVIWDNLLKWGLAQNPSISQDVTKWNKEEITIMERTLHRFVPLIRLYHISSEDFLEKVYPLKKLLPKDLVYNLLTFYLAPNKKLNVDIQPARKPKFVYDSILIESKHLAIFASWIDKKENLHYNVNNIPYSFNLLYRASRDGNIAAFHAKCDNKGQTIVVAKFSNSDQIVGGYNPFFWESIRTVRSTSDSFIFLFTNRNNLQSAKVGYSNGGQNSIRNFECHGPAFGSGSDLYCDNNNNSNNWYSNNTADYPKINGMPNGYFSVVDYEVFQVIKNKDI